MGCQGSTVRKDKTNRNKYQKEMFQQKASDEIEVHQKVLVSCICPYLLTIYIFRCL